MGADLSQGISAASRSTGLPLSHALLALAVVAVWGANFVVIRVALDHLPPLLFATLRFCFAFFPAALFIKRPAVSWRSLVGYGLFIGFGQFGLLYMAMHGHISPGLASLVAQSQVFFTIGLAMYFAGERVRPFQIVALLLATGGIGLILSHSDGTTTPAGLLGLDLKAMDSKRPPGSLRTAFSIPAFRKAQACSASPPAGSSSRARAVSPGSALGS